MVPQKVAQNDRSEHVLDADCWGHGYHLEQLMRRSESVWAQNRVLGQKWSVESPGAVMSPRVPQQVLRTTAVSTSSRWTSLLVGGISC